MVKNWIAVKAKGQPRQLLDLYSGLVSANAGCYIDSFRKVRGGYSIIIQLSPEFGTSAETDTEALKALRQLIKDPIEI